jgi:cytochrome P450
MLGARFEDGSAMSDSDVCSQLLTLLVAGHETTATTMAWAFYGLHRDPGTLRRAREEIASLGPEPEPAQLAALPYLQAVADETLRLHPLLGEAARTVKDRYSFQGYEIPAGVTVAVSIIMIHSDPELYPEPQRFRPERFLERKFGPSEHVPFGGGHRRCIGAAFAMNEIKIVLGTLLPRFELELAEDRPLATVRRNLMLAPESGVPMILRGRLA